MSTFFISHGLVTTKKKSGELYRYLQQNPEWKDGTGSVPLLPLSSILDPNSTPITFHTSITPPIAHDLCASPVIELVVLAFPSTLTLSEKTNLDTDLINFRSTLLNLCGAKPASFCSVGWLDRPGTVQHPESPSGEASLCIFVVGWGSKEEHEAARATEEFGKGIKPIREHMLPAVKELQMRHVRFKSHEMGNLGMVGVL